MKKEGRFMFKIPCGGFELDESSFSLENKKLSTQPVGWNDLKDKPFGSNMTVITWDGNTDGKEEVRLGKNAYYKVSDLTPTIEEVSNHLAITLVLPQSGAEQTMTVPKDMIVPMSGEPGEMGAFWCGSNSPLFVLPEIVGDAKGIYLVCNKALVNTEWVTEGYVSNVEFGSIKTIDPKYLPNMVVTFTMSEGGTITADKTTSEILNVVSNGGTVSGLVPSGATMFTGLSLSTVTENMARFYSMGTTDSNVVFVVVVVNADGTCSMENHMLSTT